MGSFSGRELEILVLHKFLLSNEYLLNMSNYELSIELKATETKIKNLMYEVFLRYKPDYDNYVKEKIEKSIMGMKADGSKIVLQIENTFTRKTIEEQARKLGHLVDTSFNSDLVKMSFPAFFSIIDNFLDDDKGKDLKRKKSSTRNAIEKFTENAKKDLVKKVVVGVATGGLSSMVEIADSLLESIVEQASNFSDS